MSPKIEPDRLHRPRLIELRGLEPDDALIHFFREERSRRSSGVTGFLVSGGGAGAISCWFAIGNLYLAKGPHIVLHLLFFGSAVFLSAVLVAFFAALAGYKVFDAAALMPTEALIQRDNRADRWLALANVARVISAVLIAIGGAWL